MPPNGPYTLGTYTPCQPPMHPWHPLYPHTTLQCPLTAIQHPNVSYTPRSIANAPIPCWPQASTLPANPPVHLWHPKLPLTAPQPPMPLHPRSTTNAYIPCWPLSIYTACQPPVHPNTPNAPDPDSLPTPMPSTPLEASPNAPNSSYTPAGPWAPTFPASPNTPDTPTPPDSPQCSLTAPTPFNASYTPRSTHPMSPVPHWLLRTFTPCQTPNAPLIHPDGSLHPLLAPNAPWFPDTPLVPEGIHFLSAPMHPLSAPWHPWHPYIPAKVAI